MRVHGRQLLLLGALGLPLLLLLWGIAGEDVSSRARTIAAGATDFDELSARFKDLAREEGALLAYDVLREASLPTGTDIHLLAHVVGDELYVERGIDGIHDCTDEFRNACSHAIVMGALTESGDAGLDDIRAACAQAPGGSGAYTMCFHGLGHGVFAAQGYDLEKTSAFCMKTGTPEHNDREYEECFGGAVMELMGGGGHDKEAWLAARARYFAPEDPLSPCDTPVVPEDLKGICYVYLSPHLFEAAGADLAYPLPSHFAEAFTYCDRIPFSEGRLRNGCFGGIGKEFPVLALGRDIRALHAADAGIFSTIWSWCGLAPHEEGEAACAEHVLNSLFWGGENDPAIGAAFCAASGQGPSAQPCFKQLAGLIGYYLKDDAQVEACAVVPAGISCPSRSLSP